MSNSRSPARRPGGPAGGFPGGQQVDAAGFDVHEDGAVMAALAGGVHVGADHPPPRHLRLEKASTKRRTVLRLTDIPKT
ncbi:hypothetical protein AAW14_00715 [Streptomyces hygroscopicus]|uniref:hypothetical protein n=1 Tax=Streptomyces hygroscopicus TaxID=1912 RepID=UPI002240DC8E|nr:hypothetical protein [Streptomyces hygroscopicus]MCW7940612.1 hypothetical protein [Streptomyces hygroscopicus]